MIGRTIDRDVRIQRDVLDEFAWNPEIMPTEIGIEADSGVVTLSGTVDSIAKKAAAEKSAHRVLGVRAIANDLVVRPPGDTSRTDTDIARAVANALEWSAFIPDERIHVNVEDGIVSVRGGVDYNFQRMEVERQIPGLAGVKGLWNRISVTPPVTANSEGIRSEIVRAIRRHADHDASALKVRVKGHVGTLDGAVHSDADRAEVKRLAWGLGMFTVENAIQVEPAPV